MYIADDKLLGYLVLQCARAINGKKGKNMLLKVLSGAGDHGTEETVKQFTLLSWFYPSFSRASTNDGIG